MWLFVFPQRINPGCTCNAAVCKTSSIFLQIYIHFNFVAINVKNVYF